MKVTPAKKKFGKYAVGDVFELSDKFARALVKHGILAAAPSVPDAPVSVPQPAPYVAKVEREQEGDVAVSRMEPQTYETRMLTAETPAAPTKRAYTRRTPPPNQD